MKLSGWGRYPVIEAQMYVPRSETTLRDLVRSDGSVIARGNGRAYGDTAVNASATVHMRSFNRMLAFDPAKGQLVAEAGVLLGDIISAFLPQGWFPAITPGTKFVTALQQESGVIGALNPVWASIPSTILRRNRLGALVEFSCCFGCVSYPIPYRF